MVQWLRLHLSMWTQSLVGELRVHMPCHQNIKQKQYCDTFSKDFKTGPHQKNIYPPLNSHQSGIPKPLHVSMIKAT